MSSRYLLRVLLIGLHAIMLAFCLGAIPGLAAEEWPIYFYWTLWSILAVLWFAWSPLLFHPARRKAETIVFVIGSIAAVPSAIYALAGWVATIIHFIHG